MGDRIRKVRSDDPRAAERAIPHGMRKLVIGGQTWLWRFGNHVDIRSPDGTGHRVTLAELLGASWDEIERAEHKRYLRVDPSAIVSHIQRTILGYDDLTGYPAGTPGHGSQAAIRKGWVAFAGPRGMWQTKLDPWILQIHSPEDVRHEARLNEVLGISVDEFVDIKDRDLKAIGSSFDKLWLEERERPGGKRRHQVEVMMSYDAPSMPKPTPRELENYVVRNIVGRTALRSERRSI